MDDLDQSLILISDIEFFFLHFPFKQQVSNISFFQEPWKKVAENFFYADLLTVLRL